jgi:hypothetical protein
MKTDRQYQYILTRVYSIYVCGLRRSTYEILFLTGSGSRLA